MPRNITRSTMKTKKLCLVGATVFLLVSGLILLLISQAVLRYIIRTGLVLTPNSEGSESWEHVPDLMPMDFYFFNWTNPEEVYNLSTKPKLEQLGPYRFMMDLKKVNITWNENGTVSYIQQKFWYFSPEGTNGSLQDIVTTLNSPALGAAHVARNWNYMVRRGLSFTLSGIASQIHVTHTIDEMLFTGYPDTLTQMGGSLPIFAGQDVPKWDRMGLFYERNGSIEFEGVNNMGTGINSIFGKLYSWNYRNETSFYEGQCGEIDGSTGDRFDPNQNNIKMFLPDVCRPLVLEYVGEMEVGGIMGKKYVVDERALDNGTKYPTNGCFCSGDCIPSGVWNLTSCRFGSPAFLSLPHFHKADPYYSNLVEGMNPDKDKHEFFIVLEPITGIPLQANAKLQVNFMLHSIPSITMYEDAPTVYFPLIWFDQQATIPEKNLSDLKLLLNVPTIMICSGSLLITGGVVLSLILIVRVMKKRKELRVARKDEEEDVPLKANANLHNKLSKS